jgi:hypothetical protein
MVKIREGLLALGLILAATIAAAGTLVQGKPSHEVGYPDCTGATGWMTELTGEADIDNAHVQDIVGQEDRSFDEYLSFHAQVTEENGKFSLMPWSGLRTHAN